MKTTIACASLGLMLALGACAQNTTRPTDTGSMAYPAPRATGQYGSSTSTAVNPANDSGSMAYPVPRASGTLQTTTPTGVNPAADSGSMAYPTTRSTGQLPARTTP